MVSPLMMIDDERILMHLLHGYALLGSFWNDPKGHMRIAALWCFVFDMLTGRNGIIVDGGSATLTTQDKGQFLMASRSLFPYAASQAILPPFCGHKTLQNKISAELINNKGEG
ncbi:hypothetical protein AMTR_s00158p00090880 [Amborella trichopoda]|uniref:Uncharacterized protein n=1 Tax=Amborella trichopoda TaxID=13333 RepID=W1PSY6_AMBTC|nr:hypothetical protein AMTR_s00158p00090880 [Amborella trichopoda]